MKILFYSSKDFEIPFLEKANTQNQKITFIKDALTSETALKAAGYKAISIFSGDDASSLVLEKLWDLGVKYITLRSAGHNNVHLEAAKNYGFKVANAPDYSPYAIAEHATALLLALNRKIVTANAQVKAYNFVQDNLMGFNLRGKTVGLIGTGSIGAAMASIMNGFGCTILAYDIAPNYELEALYNLKYKSLGQLCGASDIISLHIPLTEDNHYLINKERIYLMKKNVIIVNTARGAHVHTLDIIEAIENKQIGGYCTDVYEKEAGTFFKDFSNEELKDETLKKLLSLSNVLLTPHQGYMTNEALQNIADLTFENLNAWKEHKISKNEL
ncbi:2-hydroxyacid dehydrogenase [Cellulophaga sp. E16_2]|uniref:D-lactate dehydrogenase n=1 Tax=Cellulophaga algicola (strain DSM 14237 / IC166 / ACAM 630) TaxID=688270 RepID=E6XF62_CELAD|nr:MULTISPECIES: 2-hydroxyacid dehydrogenase [Cellulophaga]ADV50298.1 D-lactate dehydrogenase [Cellulophaga algicola DSM 14237]MBO0592700.1 2-hydroxyacid dehydrogenase [Cellulophaga sp. E16_2]